MRPIHLARLDKTRPVVVLTREVARPYLRRITVAPVTSTVRGMAVEVPVGASSGLNHESVVNCDDIQTIPVADLGRHIGFLPEASEALLTEAISAAFDLED